MHISKIVSGTNVNDSKLVILQIQHNTSSQTCITNIKFLKVDVTRF